MLRPFMSETTFGRWDEHVITVAFADNCSIQSSIRAKPFSLMFMREPFFEMDIALNLPSTSLAAENVAGSYDIVIKTVQANLEKAQSKQKEYFDRSHEVSSCKEGDLVLYEIPTLKVGEASKLQPRAKGPFRIVKKVNDLAFTIVDINDAKSKPETVSSRRLRIFDACENTSTPQEIELKSVNECENQDFAAQTHDTGHDKRVEMELAAPARSSARIKARRDAGLYRKCYDL